MPAVALPRERSNERWRVTTQGYGLRSAASRIGRRGVAGRVIIVKARASNRIHPTQYALDRLTRGPRLHSARWTRIQFRTYTPHNIV